MKTKLSIFNIFLINSSQIIYNLSEIRRIMPILVGTPEKYKLYMYSALGIMFGGVVTLIIALIIHIPGLLYASFSAAGFGFLLSMGIALGLMRKKKKDTNAEFNITILIRIVLILAFAACTYFIVFSAYYNEVDPYSTEMLITQAIAIPIVVISLIVGDTILSLRRKKKETS